ncbi:hypothetical protein B0H14DRAFT_3452013 [Mycena olivaceomarginata]|nr:hypothetical protein B0H14DRAFT_3452013 [Mycena olivaceomarginata]
MAGVSEEMSSIETEPQEFGVLEEGMMSVKSEDSPLLALLIAASSGVLHLVRRDETPNPQEQFDQGQDNDEEMVDAPRHWTTDVNKDIGMGPSTRISFNSIIQIHGFGIKYDRKA